MSPASLRRRVLVVVLAAATLAVASGCDAGPPAAAKVNDHQVPADVLDDLLGALAASTPQFRGGGEGTFVMQGAASVLTYLVDRQLILDVAESRGVVASDTQRTAAEQAVIGALGQDEAAAKKVFDRLSESSQDHLVEAQAAQTALQADLGQNEDPEARAREAYEANQAQYVSVCLSALTVADEAALTAAQARLDRGEDFAAVARDVSIDDVAAAGGELDCIPLGQISDPTAAQQIGAASAGDVIGPIGVPGQLVLVLVREKQQQSFDEVKAQILEQLPPAGEAELARFVEPLRRKARISINPRYGRWDGKAGQVVPPRSPRGATTTTIPAAPSSAGG